MRGLKFILWAVLPASVVAQAPPAPPIPSVNGTPSVSIAPGGPSGSFELGGFEDINVYNGSVNIALPLYTTQGRGKSGFTLGLAISPKPWTVQTNTSTYCNLFGVCWTTYNAAGAVDWWNPGGATVINGAGTVYIHNSGFKSYQCSDHVAPGAYNYEVTFSYVAFVSPDGVEHNLYDTQGPNGAGLDLAPTRGCTYVASRGNTFVSRDGSGMTFVSDSEILDDVDPAHYPDATAQPAAGTLFLPDGTKYHVTSGLVDTITDSNGNQTSIAYRIQGRFGVTAEIDHIVDSMGRIVSMSYGTGAFDPISINFKGASGAPRTITIKFSTFESRLRADIASPYPDQSGPYHLNFNNLRGTPVVSTVVLPNGQTYEFYYETYGQVARIEVPTGGVIEYDFGPGIAPDTSNGAYPSGQLLDDLSGLLAPGYKRYTDGIPDPPPWQPVVYRRLLERRTYEGGGSKSIGTSASSVTTYSRPETIVSSVKDKLIDTSDGVHTLVSDISFQSTGYVEVTESGSNVSAPITTRHYFHGKESIANGFNWGIVSPGGPAADLVNNGGRPSFSWPRSYPDPYFGKEFKTEIPGRQTVQEVWGIVNGRTKAAKVCQQNTTLFSSDGSSGTTRGSQVFYDLQADGSPAATILESPTDIFEFDYGAPQVITQTAASSVHPNYNEAVQICPNYAAGGAAIRQTHTDYVLDSQYLTASIRDLPSAQVVCAPGQCGSANYASKSAYFYDNKALPSSCGNGSVASVTSLASPVQQDSQYGADSSLPRGNLNCELHYYRHTSGTERQIDKTYEYDQTGNLVVARDSNQNVTSFSYSASCGAYGASYAFPTTVTNALGQPINVTYDCDLGKPSSITDRNGVTNTYSYNLPQDNLLDRLGQAVESSSSTDPSIPALKRTTTFSYSDNLGVGATGDGAAHASVTVIRDLFTGGDQQLVSTTQFDGFGRSIQTSVQEPSIAITTTTEYDGLGRVWKKSNPVRGTPQDSDKTTLSYDSLGRVIAKTLPDGSRESLQFDGSVQTNTDPAGRSISSTTDGLGRLVTADENNTGDSNAPTYTTTYSYDLLNNLIQVNQGSQIRCFYYDELKRLRAAAYPEILPANSAACTASAIPSAGVVQYSYDNNGNLTRKTNASGTTIDYSPGGSPIDALNRVTGKNYSDSTPTVRFSYDSCTGGKGRLCGGTVTGSDGFSSSTTYSYDSLGRFASANQTTNGYSYTSRYAWNLLDGLGMLTYPSGRTVTYGFDANGRVNGIAGKTVTGGANPYVSGIQYAAHGPPTAISLANGLVEQTCFNNRLQPTAIRAGIHPGSDCSRQSNDLFHAALDYRAGADNGNVWGQTQTLQNDDGSVSILTQSYEYDGVNRLNSVVETASAGSWRVGFGYDRFGNRWISSSTIPTPIAAAVGGGQFDAATNRIAFRPDGASMPPDGYDKDGNLRNHPMVGKMKYDAEGRLTDFSRAGLSGQFWYDAAGERVAKTFGGGTTIYVHGADGGLMAEYGSASSGGAGTQFLTADHLGSTRLVTDDKGARASCSDYFPFGGEIATDLPAQLRNGASCYSTGSDVAQKFTGKERDSESGLDYFGARYYGSGLGRWTSPDDPFADQRPDDPQSWNMYNYVRNNPLRHIDPNGRGCLDPYSALTCSLPPGQRRMTADEANKTAVGVAVGAGVVGTGGFAGEFLAAARALGTALFGWALTHPETVHQVAEGVLSPPGAGPSVWSLSPIARGAAVETQLGANLPRNFPTIDKFTNSIATSIKSLDLNAKSYQDVGKLATTVTGYIDKVAKFNGASLSGVTVSAGQIAGRELELAVPGAGSAAQRATLASLSKYATSVGVTLKIKEIQ